MDSMTSLPMSTEEVPAAPISPFGLVGLSHEGVGECSIDPSFDSAVCSAGVGLEGHGLGGLAVLFDLVGDSAFPEPLKIQNTSSIAYQRHQEGEFSDPIAYPLERLQTSSTRILF